MKPFSLLIKPASADCNLRCDYCFYLDHDRLYPASRVHRMPPAVLERMISSYLALEMDCHVFMWQGGEPTLMGLEFFRKVTSLQVKHGRPGTRVVNGLQTNALLLDDEFARHLARYNFLVGVSLDGPAAVHDRHRKTAAGGGSHARVLAAIEHLRRHQVAFNILTLVTAANVQRAAEIYAYLTQKDFNYLQFIPCVEFSGDGRPLPYTVGSRAWGRFLYW